MKVPTQPMRAATVRFSLVLMTCPLLLGKAGSASAGASMPDTRRLLGAEGAAVSAVELINLGSRPLTAALTLRREGGDEAIALPSEPVAPLRAHSLYLPSDTSLTDGAYGLRAEGDQPLGLVTRTAWPASGAAVLLTAPSAGRRIDVPVWRNPAGWRSWVSIQNMDLSQVADVSIRVGPEGGVAGAEAMVLRLPPAASTTLDVASEAALAGFDLEQTGLLQIRATARIGVQTAVDVASSPQAAFGFALTPAEQADRTWQLPRLRADAAPNAEDLSERHRSRVLVVNSSDAAADIVLTYRGSAGACAKQTVVHGGGTITVPAGSMRVLHQAGIGAAGAPNESGLPQGCSASGILRSNVPVTAYVVDVSDGLATGESSSAAAHSAAGASQGLGQQLLVPLWRSNQTATRLSTDLTLLNTSAARADITIALLDRAGALAPCQACDRVLGPGESILLSAEDLGAPLGQSATALIESSQALAVLVEDRSRRHSGDFTADLALSIDAPTFPAGQAVGLPQVLKGQVVAQPSTPTPIPSARPSARPSAWPPRWRLHALGFVDIAGGGDPNCPGCNQRIDPEDEAFAVRQPLSAFEVRVLNATGKEMARATSGPMAFFQSAILTLPPLEQGAAYEVELVKTPPGWFACGGASRTRLSAADFTFGIARVDHHFTFRQCPPLQPSATPRGAVLTPTPGAPLAKHEGSSNLSLVNLGSDPGDVEILLADHAGRRTDLSHRGLAPGGAITAALGESMLPPGAYSALATSNQWIGAVSLTRLGDALAGMEPAEPGIDLVLPLVAKGALGIDSWLVLQNLDSKEGVTVEVVVLGQDGRRAATASLLLPAGAGRGVDLGRDPAFADLPMGFVGWLRLRAAKRVVAQLLLDFEQSPAAAAGYAAMPAVAAVKELVLPRVFSKMPADPRLPTAGEQETRLAVANPAPVPAQVRVTYLGRAGACAGRSIAGETRQVAPEGMAWFALSTEPLPAGCVASAWITADSGVLAVGLDAVEAGAFLRTAAATTAFRPAQAARRFMVPYLRKLQDGLSTDLSLANPSDEPATVALRLLDREGRPVACPSSCRLLLGAGEAHTVAAESIEGLPWSSVGSLWIDASAPVVVQVTESDRTLRADQATYSAIAAGEGAAAAEPLAFPLALADGGLRLPGPALTPYEPPLAWPPLASQLSAVTDLQVLYLPRLRGGDR